MPYFVYITTNHNNTTLYTGFTNDLKKRVFEHSQESVDGFTKKYRAHKLVYYEILDNVENAIQREKQIKAGSRQKKMDLINKKNRDWNDLSLKL